MTATISSELLLGLLLLFTRVAATIGFVPLPYLKGSAPGIRVGLAVLLTAVLLPVWLTGGRAWTVPAGIVPLVFMILAEASFGVAMGVIVSLLCEMFGMAAQFLGLQAGYGYASTIDPTTEADSGVLLVLAQLGGWLLFLALGADRFVILALARSLEVHPLGTFTADAGMAAVLTRFGSAVLSGAWRISLPVIALLLLVDLSLAAFGRLHAQLQLLTMAFPAKMLLAVWVLGLSYRAMASVFERVAADAGEALMRVAGG